MKRAGWMAFFLAILASESSACNVPVFRYALERWSPSPHVVRIAPNIEVDYKAINVGHSANCWVERAPSSQRAEVTVSYADGDAIWYEGPWELGLLNRLTDSPLRRQIAQELVTGTIATFVVLESDNTALNDETEAMIHERLAIVKPTLTFEENLDYEDDSDGYHGVHAGSELSEIPLEVKFSVHRVSRMDPDESLFVRQITQLDPLFAGGTAPVIAVIYGQGRLIPLDGDNLAPDVIDEVCSFLGGACSCRVKALNPGIDLLIAARWYNAVHKYPAVATSILPEGGEFKMGGTGAAVESIVSFEPVAISQKEPEGDKKSSIVLISGLAGAVLFLLVWLVRT